MTRCAREVALWSLCLVLLMAACSESHKNLVSDPNVQLRGRDSGAVADSGGGSVKAETSPDGGQVVSQDAATAYCGKRACTCDDGADNDGDGLVDGLDPECTGAYDDDESSFATGQANQQQACRDCYWDANSGSGDDGCRYASECLTQASFVGKGNCGTCTVTSECESSCKNRTPNGCDCFGCCALQVPQGEVLYVQLVDSCTSAKANDSAACPRCTPHETCKNECARCELCLGKTLADLPADCRSGTGPGYVCEDGLTVCSPSTQCPDGFYCQQGCCLVDLL